MVIFDYIGLIEEHKNILLANTIVGLKDTLKEKNINGVFISLKNTLYDKSSSHLEHFVRQLDVVSQKLSIIVIIGDYKKIVFSELKAISKHTQVKLFQDINTATLFLNPSAQKKQLNILLYEEDQENADKLASELLKLGYSITHSKDIEDFKEKASAKKHDMTITQNAINLQKSSFALPLTLGLSKQLIMNLPIFIDTAVHSLITITGLEAQKIKHEIIPFNEKISSQVIIALMKFKGDISGSFFLIFPRDIAVIALEAMLGEPVSIDDTATIIDGVAEFCNIITGSAKAILSNKKIKVLFELPKTHASLNVALGDTFKENGIWIEMQLDGKPFYMFIGK